VQRRKHRFRFIQRNRLIPSEQHHFCALSCHSLGYWLCLLAHLFLLFNDQQRIANIKPEFYEIEEQDQIVDEYHPKSQRSFR
jgi:hypothetical protein